MTVTPHSPVRLRAGVAVAAAVAFTLLGPARAAGAQQAAGDTILLSLSEAVEVARGSNPAYRRAVNSAELNAVGSRATLFTEVLPRAQLNLFQTQFTGNLTRRGFDNFGNPIERPDADWNYFSQTNQSLTLSWRIQGRSLFDALDRQRLVNQDRDAAEVRALADMHIGVQRAFMETLEQRELTRAEEELLTGRRTDREVAERLFELALKTRVDVLNAELAVEQQVLALRQQEARWEQARLALRTSLGDDGLPPFRLAETALPIFDPASLDADALVHTARSVNPALRQADVALRTADLGLVEARRAWWPTLIMGFSLARRVQGSESEALFDVSPDESLDQQFYLGMEFPMFTDFFSNRRAQHQARVALSNEREAVREAELGVEEAVRSAHLELANQFESLRLARRSQEIAAEALRLAREEYRLGTRTFETLRNAFDQEALTRRQVIQARFAFVDALLTLEEAVGAPVRPPEN